MSKRRRAGACFGCNIIVEWCTLSLWLFRVGPYMHAVTPKILIVDDNEDNRYTLELFLRADGYQNIATASGGQQAIAAISHEAFGLVLLDMVMPDLSGEEVLKILKGSVRTRELPVVVISADSEHERVSRCIAAGADDYLSKPFDSAILRARVASALRKHSLRELEAEYRTRIEQESRKSEDLLRNVLPPVIAARLRAGEPVIADQVSNASIVFADIVGFTKLSAGMHAYEVVSCLNKLFSEFDELAAQEAVEKIKTIGDCYMAASGIPVPRSDHAIAAARFARGMILATERLRTAFPVPLQIRVGVHSGPVMAGVIGRRTFAYDVWGDTVNIAARLEASAVPGRALVSAATAAQLSDQFQCEAFGNIAMKDGRSIEAMFLLEPSSR